MEVLKAFVEDHAAALTGGILSLMVIELIRSKVNPAYVFAAVVFLFVLFGYLSVDDILNAAITKSILSIFIVVALSSIINKHIDLGAYFDQLLGKITSPILFLGLLGGVGSADLFGV